MGKYYGKKVLQEFLNPQNVGELEDADLVFTEDNPVCTADSPPSPCHLKLYLKIDKNRIGEAKFKLQGCVAAVAFLSKLTSMLKGKTLEEALKLTKEEILEALEQGIPDEKLSCPIIGIEKLQKELLPFLKKNSKTSKNL